MPFCMILCKKLGIKRRKTCNGLRDPFKWLVMQENTLNGFECNKIGDNTVKCAFVAQ